MKRNQHKHDKRKKICLCHAKLSKVRVHVHINVLPEDDVDFAKWTSNFAWSIIVFVFCSFRIVVSFFGFSTHLLQRDVTHKEMIADYIFIVLKIDFAPKITKLIITLGQQRIHRQPVRLSPLAKSPSQQTERNNFVQDILFSSHFGQLFIL